MRRRLIVAGKLLLAAVLVGAVGWQFAKLLRSPELSAVPIVVRPGWLVAAGLLYVLAQALWGGFFVTLLGRIAGPVPWPVGLRAYFVSQVGKYVPGKAWVVLLRVLLLRPWGLSPVGVGVAATYETLTSMAAGALIAAALLPLVAPGEDVRSKVVLSVAVLAVGLPVGAVALYKLADWLVARRGGPPLPHPPLSLMARGLVQDSAGWLLLGLSLACTLRGLDFAADPAEYPAHLFAVAASYVAGFVIPTPGGLGTREFVLQKVLAPRTGAAEAALIAVAVRLTWTAAEAVLVGLLWLAGPRPAMPTEDPATPEPGTDDAGPPP